MSDNPTPETPEILASDKSQTKPASAVKYVDLYESDTKVYTRKITGFFQAIRRYTGLPLIAGYILLPWIMLNGRPAVLFDLTTRQFHILNATFWPQDFMFLGWLLIISAFALFTVTVLLGRVWCGFTCPQTVWTLMFISIERFVEGDRNKQIKLDSKGWTPEKIFKKSTKHGLWLLIAFITGLTFVGYFVPIRELILGFIPYYDDDTGILTLSAHPGAIFWTLFFTAMTYLNAGWLREQVCKYMCPYARFQSVMYDKDTIAVQYDEKRGETRGARKISEENYKEKGMGDCIDCSWCVQVCPVDIDIRDGMQYECINCGLCVDACNAVMDKMKYDRGLIRFTSEDELETGKTNFFRPRLFGYAAGMIVMIVAFVVALAMRTPLTVDLTRDRGANMFRVTNGQIQNVYTLQINNMSNDTHSYSIDLEGDLPYKLHRYMAVSVLAGERFTIPVRVSVPKTEKYNEKNFIRFVVTAKDDPEIVATEESNFIAPVKRRE